MSLLTREQQHFFINLVEIKGIQSIQSQALIGVKPYVYAGMQSIPFLPSDQGGTINVSTLMVSDDPFIQFTGENYFNGFVINDSRDTTRNFSFSSGYLTAYNATFAIGEIPQVNVEIQAFGNIGRLSNTDVTGVLSGIQSQSYTTLPLKIPSPGSITIALTGLDTLRVKSCAVSIASNRRPDYALGNRFPVRVALTWPIEVNCKFSVSAYELSLSNIRDPGALMSKTDILLSVADFNSTSGSSNNYFFENMQLLSYEQVSDINDSVTVDFSYQGFIFPRPPLVTKDLRLYIDTSLPRCYPNNGVVNDLSLYDNLGGTVGSPAFFSRHILLDGVNDQIQFSRFAMGKDMSVALWAMSSNYVNISGSVIFSLQADAFVKGLNLLFAPTPYTCWASGEDTSNQLQLSFPSGSQWKHFALVSDSVGKIVTYYIDGAKMPLVVNNYYNTTMSSNVNNNNLIIGASANGGYYFSGAIDNLALYGRTLTQSEIIKVIKATKPV